MSIKFPTGTPQGLLDEIREAIDSGEVRSWSYDTEGDFTHDSTQWRDRAWLRPTVNAGALNFEVVKNKDLGLSKQVNGLYHGRFIDMLLTHFSDKISTVTATSSG